MKAMVFAAGRGLRLRPFTEEIPKALVPVAGRPMIEYPLLLLRHYGIRQIVINLHYLREQVMAHLGNGENLGLTITYSLEEKLLDTGGGLLKAKAALMDGTFIVINTDVLIDVSLAEVLAFHRLKRATATLVLRPDPLADQFGSMEIDPDGRIGRFLAAKRPGYTTGVSSEKLMFTGVQVLEPRIFDYMVSAEPFGITRSTYPALLLHGEPLYGFVYRGFWSDLGTSERIRLAEQALLTKRANLHFL